MSGGLITNSGKQIMLDRTYNGSPTRTEPSEFSVGVDGTAASVGDTGLGEAVPISGTEQVDDCDSITGWTDSADMTLAVDTSTFKQGTGSLSFTKDGTGFFGINSFKTTPSLDFTNKEIEMWVYIIDSAMLAKLASTAITLDYGSDASNIYRWDILASSLSVGWNRIFGKTSANATSVSGTPILTAMDYLRITFAATGAGITWSDGDLLVDDIKLVSSDDYKKIFESGYPIFDFTALQVTIRCRLSTVQANGYGLQEFGIFNTDGTPLLESRDTYAVFSKSLTDEIIFVAKNQML